MSRLVLVRLDEGSPRDLGAWTSTKKLIKLLSCINYNIYHLLSKFSSILGKSLIGDWRVKIFFDRKHVP